MTRRVLALPATADVTQVAAFLVGHRVTSVPILDGRRVVGMVSRRDLLRVLIRDDALIAQEVRRRLVAYFIDVGPRVLVRDGIVEISDPGGDHARWIAVNLARTVPGVIRVRFVNRSAPDTAAVPRPDPGWRQGV